MKLFTFIRNTGISLMLLAFVGGGIGAATANAKQVLRAPGYLVNSKQETQLSREVRRELRRQDVISPAFNVFNNLEYKINGGRVTLFGQVVNPVLSSYAENSVKNIKGVTQVVNKIQVLPLSGFDNQIRWAEYRSIFSEAALTPYAIEPIPSIHIIVDNGHVTLVGYVANKMDRELAGIRAKMVPNVFSVKNDLRVG